MQSGSTKTLPRLSPAQRKQLSSRMGDDLLSLRIWKEDTRELHFGGRVRWCPMKVVKPLATLALKALGLWRRGRRNYLSISVREESFHLTGLHPDMDGYALLLLSDLHIDLDEAFPATLQHALESVKGKYSAVAIVGDFNNLTAHSDCKALDLVRELMPCFSAPVYGVLGNHDSIHDVPILEDAGIRMLVNESVILRHGSGAVRLAGIDDPNIFGTHDLKRALASSGVSETERLPSILLSHAPSIHLEAAREGIDLVLSGHVHGGQICTKKGRMLVWHRWKFPRKVWTGRWREGSTQGYTTSGVGACGIPIRFNCPPEIVIVRLFRA